MGAPSTAFVFLTDVSTGPARPGAARVAREQMAVTDRRLGAGV